MDRFRLISMNSNWLKRDLQHSGIILDVIKHLFLFLFFPCLSLLNFIAGVGAQFVVFLLAGIVAGLWLFKLS